VKIDTYVCRVLRNSRPVLLGPLLLAVLSSCSLFEQNKDGSDTALWQSEEQMRAVREQREAARVKNAPTPSAQPVDAKSTQGRPQTRIRPGPGVRYGAAMTDLEAEELLPTLTGEPIQSSFNDMPLPAFIDTVFGEQLSLPYSLDPALAEQNDRVTLRLVESVSPADLFRIARRTLVDYGVAMRLEEGIFVFYIDKNISKRGDVPILVSGSALPDVPDSHRPVFIFVPLSVVKPNQVVSWVKQSMEGRDIEVIENPIRGSVVIKGKPALVEQALAMVKLLDQPHMRGKHSVIIEPVFVQVNDLATDLLGVLQAEGYDASLRPPVGTVLLMALQGGNQLVVFAPDAATLAHVEHWARVIDRRQKLGIKDGVFTHQVANTSAEYIVELLRQMEKGGGGATDDDDSSAGVGDEDRPDGGTAAASGRKLVVDTNRNAIIFRGTGKAWAELLPVIKEMDVQSPSVLVEVLLAEISLDNTESSSVQFLAKSSINGYDLDFGTLGLLDSGTSAFTAVLGKAGETRAILKFLYENNRAEIRSRPRLMVKSGQSASIDVGDEVPVVTTSSQSVDDPGAPLVQNIVYRNTGIRLQIKPVVHSSGYVDVEVIQELSEAQVNETSGIDSPTIRNRSVQTTVTLRDGGSILLGGLISTVTTQVEKGVPLLSSIPGLGYLFKSQGDTQERRELVMMIIPYVLDSPEDAQELTEQMTVIEAE
jgi:general secretion pathway protein D